MIEIDEIGLLYEPVVLGDDGRLAKQPAALPGWHVNASATVAAWAAQRVTPATPRRVFGGQPTTHYTFASQAEFDAARKIANLDTLKAVRVPGSITMRQAQLALLGSGKLATVNAAVAAMPGPQGDAARIEWATSSTVERNKPLVLAMASLLGLTAEQVDALFLAGEKL